MSTAAAAKYQELRSKIAEAKKVMEQTAKALFIEMAASLFADNPTLESFGWTQYTPYWNDGDVCTFRCHGSYPTVSMTLGSNIYSYDSNQGELQVNGKDSESADELIRNFKSMGIDSFARGGKTYAYDAATGTVTADGIKVRTYEETAALFDPLEKVVSDFMRNFEDEDMLVMFGDHTQVTVNRNGKIEIEDYDHE